MSTRAIAVAAGAIIVLLAGLPVARGLAQAREERPAAAEPAPMPDLPAGLKATPGCLGVETAVTAGGKRVIFAWFEDKEAVLRWYYSEMHQQAMDQFFPDSEHGEPMADVPDGLGPIMVIASITMSDQAHFGETTLPVSQIAIELYQPVTGGLYLGGRFAPDGVEVKSLKDYTPH